MNKTRNFLTALIVLLLLGVFGCVNDPDGGNGVGSGSGSSGGEVSLTPVQPTPTPTPSTPIDLSPFLKWEWIKDSNDGTEFTYKFKTNGSISVTHCCGLEFEDSYSYFVQQGNVLVTYGTEMDSDKLEVNTFTIAPDGLSFTLNNGTKYKKGEAVCSDSALVLSNPLLGTWKGSDGKTYVFGSDASLKINSDNYGYLVKDKYLAIRDVKSGNSQQYIFTQKENTLSLSSTSSGSKITLAP